ncbi:unnamed protein product [Danaus chrysippus]|uniref:(African queen) hypothetical protein n=1 Tax=Danaus chrysippus TaxID=151541 RepID=A0A8J2QHC8_9NEOP|nr:unnamed protein product [Danaus chrysippus]
MPPSAVRPTRLSGPVERFALYLVKKQTKPAQMRLHLSRCGHEGTLYFEFPNAYSRWTPIEKTNYCIDIDSDLNPKFWSVMTSEDATENNQYYTGGIIISSVFLVAVFLVYAILPELQNLAGLVLMAYVFSLGAAFIILACLQLIGMDVLSCIVLTGMCYFFFLSTFCWMNIMSYDIWWTFRGYAKARTIHRKGVRFKFIMYCLYAYGVPTLMTIGLMTVNSMDLRHYPWIITPQIPKFGCFIEGGQKFVYLYIPMLVLILCNWMFYLMTAFNIWRLVRGTAILNSTHRSQKNRLMVYLKISVIMGINWLLEVVSFLTPKLTIWLYTDAYNVLMGLAIFLIFVWKRKIYRKLKARLTPSPIVPKLHHSSTSSTLESSLGQETSTVSINPRGK